MRPADVDLLHSREKVWALPMEGSHINIHPTQVTEVYKSIHGASGQGLHMTAFQVWAEVKALKLTKESRMAPPD